VLRVAPVAFGAGASEASVEAAERLIPFVSAYVDDVSLAQRRITVDWGLDY
jgi:16S rRNA processing protein RimM